MAIALKQKTPRFAAKASEMTLGSDSVQRRTFTRRFGKPVKPGELIFFFSQLSLMVEIGMSLKDGLMNIEQQTENTAFKTVIQSTLQDIEEGRQLSDSMRRHPRIFKPMYVSMVKAGETGGFLKNILDRIVEMEEKRQALINQVKNALTYPTFLCVLGFVVVIFIMVSVLPKFMAFFEGRESILPGTTRFLIAASTSLREYGLIYALAGIGLAVFLKFYRASAQGQALIDRLFVSGPLIAGISNKIYTSELLRTLGNLMESQVPLLEALNVTRDSIRNRHFRHFVDQIADHVQKGGRFSQPFATYPYVMDSVKQVVATGEEVGNLPKVMLRLAQFYDTEVERNLKRLASLIEPVALIVLGAVVGLVVSSVILPIFRMAQMAH
jgi:type II secretory pathway component PulF